MLEIIQLYLKNTPYTPIISISFQTGHQSYEYTLLNGKTCTIVISHHDSAPDVETGKVSKIITYTCQNENMQHVTNLEEIAEQFILTTSNL